MAQSIPRRVDDSLVIWANRAARRSTPGRLVVHAAARWLSVVEIALMVALGAAGRRGSVVRMLAGVSTVYVACELLGALWPRRRPFVSLSSEVISLVAHDGDRSFPSRHVAAGLTMASVGHTANPLLGGLMAQVALLLGLSRVAAGLHYPSDVLGGAALGWLVGRYSRRT